MIELWLTAWSYAQRRTSFTRWENQDSFEIKIHNNIWGFAAKLKFSNWYGSRSVGIKKVTLSQKGNIYQVKVRGKANFYLTPTEDIYSDPIYFDIAIGQPITIKVIFVEKLRPESGNTFPNGIAMALQSVLVASYQKCNVAAFFGDSIMHRGKWVQPLIEKWYVKYPGSLAAFEVSVDGSRLLNDSPSKEDGTLGFRAVKRFQHDILENPGINYVLFSLGFNDLAIQEKGERILTVESYRNEVMKIITLSHMNEIKIIGLTVTPRRINESYTIEKNHLRKEINRWILQDAPFDLAVDIDNIISNEENTALKNGYGEADGVHINEKAGMAIAEALDEAKIFL